MFRKILQSLKAPSKPHPQTNAEVTAKAPTEKNNSAAPHIRHAKYKIGQVVHHRLFDFRGVIFDVDPEFANSEDWYLSIPENIRPHRDQPYYHVFAENADGHYTAYVSEQNLVIDNTAAPIKNPDVNEVFTLTDNGSYQLRPDLAN